MDPTEIDIEKIDALVEACQKNMAKAGCKDILSLKEEIGKLNPGERKDFVQKYSGLFSSKPEAPAAAATSEKPRIVGALGPWPPGVPRKVKGGKSHRRRNKKGKKKTNKRRRN